MHMRISTKRRGDKTYRYVQFVESYRRPDGMPTQRVIATLGDLPSRTIENLQLALRASRQGAALVVASDVPALTATHKVKANYRYLDLAVLLEMWREWKLDALLQELVDDGQSHARFSDVLAALTIQRCAAPGSKLYAKQWFPTTALPELLGLSPKAFNNTRIHRVLRQLEGCTEELQQRLPGMYQKRHGAFASLFLDTTDTHFEGRGCTMARRGRTKAGHSNKRHIGLLLLCNEHGLPLRWMLLPGNTKDHTAMGDMVTSLKGVSWVQKVPVVCDRAMGKQSSVRRLLETELHFLTASHVDSIDSYTAKAHQKIPADKLSATKLAGTEELYRQDIETMREAARKNALVQVDEFLFVLDLGVVVVNLDGKETEVEADQPTPSPQAGMVQNAVTEVGANESESASSKLRLVAYFNPMMFVDQRRRAQKHLDELNAFVDALNKELAEASRSRDSDSTRRKVVRILEKRSWVDLFDLTLHPIQVSPKKSDDLKSQTQQPSKAGSKEKSVDSFQCELTLKQDAWNRRLRYNGFVLLLGHPDLPQTAKDLALMYRAKDAVEKDFQTIKSVVELRPIFHYTDPKVCAHITLCMLALLLQRTLEQRLRARTMSLSTPATVEALRTCHLNLLEPLAARHSLYTVTATTQIQREILNALGLLHLIDDTSMSRAITRRADSCPSDDISSREPQQAAPK